MRSSSEIPNQALGSSFEVVYCLGSCGLAPVAVVDDQTIGKLAPERMSAILAGETGLSTRFVAADPAQ